MSRGVEVVIKVPRWLEKPLVFSALLYRRVRYGYAFRRIPLTRGQYAIVDPDRYDSLNKHKWFALVGQRTFYASRRARVREKSKGRTIWMHRVVMEAPDEMFVDHINHDGLDNRVANLRLATHNENTRNRQKTNMKTRSRYKGLTLHKNRRKGWCARIRVNGKPKFLGFFADEMEAAKAYDKAARKYHGRFACINFPDAAKN